MKIELRTLLLCSWTLLIVACAPKKNLSDDRHQKDIKAFQEKLILEYADAETPPLNAEELKEFPGLKFFPIDKNFRVIGRFIRTPDEKPFPMAKSDGKTEPYVKYARAVFSLSGNEYELGIYQNIRLSKMPGFEDYLFIPFKDGTSGEETYGAGRYLEVRMPRRGETVELDFNKAYHPYCAYTDKFSCPIPPRENKLPIKVLAGVRMP